MLGGEWRDRSGCILIGGFAEQASHVIVPCNFNLSGSHGFPDSLAPERWSDGDSGAAHGSFGYFAAVAQKAHFSCDDLCVNLAHRPRRRVRSALAETFDVLPVLGSRVCSTLTYDPVARLCQQ